MNHHYEDILNLTKAKPRWFDEHAVPRFCDFGPRLTANIYADEAVLLVVECQNCGQPFRVALSWGFADKAIRKTPSLTERARDSGLEYGDPPNIRCCPAGPTMNSVPRRVLEFWTRDTPGDWIRWPEREGEIRCSWWDESDGGAAVSPSRGEGG